MKEIKVKSDRVSNRKSLNSRVLVSTFDSELSTKFL